MSADERDPELESLWRTASRDEPPAALDAAIAAAARRDIARSVRGGRTWWPMAAAATVAVIAVGIAQLTPPERVTPGDAALGPGSGSRSDAPASAPTSSGVLSAPAGAEEDSARKGNDRAEARPEPAGEREKSSRQEREASPAVENRQRASAGVASDTADGRASASPRAAPPPQASPPQASPPQALPPQALPPQTSPPQTSPPQTSPPQTSPPQTSPPQTSPPQTSPRPPAPPPLAKPRPEAAEGKVTSQSPGGTPKEPPPPVAERSATARSPALASRGSPGPGQQEPALKAPSPPLAPAPGFAAAPRAAASPDAGMSGGVAPAAPPAAVANAFPGEPLRAGRGAGAGERSAVQSAGVDADRRRGATDEPAAAAGANSDSPRSNLSGSESATTAARLPAAEWIERIRKLLARGADRQALAELGRFRLAYGADADRLLPADLRALKTP